MELTDSGLLSIICNAIDTIREVSLLVFDISTVSEVVIGVEVMGT